MPFKKIQSADVDFFRTVVGDKYVLTDDEHIDRCASDETEDLHYPPEVVVQPGDTAEVSKILKHCNEQRIPVTPRGAGIGLSGGALPVHGGVALDTILFN